MALYNEFIEKVDKEEKSKEDKETEEVYDSTISDVIRETKDDPSKKQGMAPGETSEDIREDMETGEKEENVYSEEGRENLTEDDELEPSESGFMEGAEGRGKKTSCAECGAMISEDDSSIVEREFNGEMKWFCSVSHAENYAKKHPEEENQERVED